MNKKDKNKEKSDQEVSIEEFILKYDNLSPADKLRQIRALTNKHYKIMKKNKKGTLKDGKKVFDSRGIQYVLSESIVEILSEYIFEDAYKEFMDQYLEEDGRELTFNEKSKMVDDLFKEVDDNE